MSNVKEDLREELLGAAANYIACEKSYEAHLNDPNGAASMELAEEMLDNAVVVYSHCIEGIYCKED